MSTPWPVLVAAPFVAAILGFLSPYLLARVPEPEDPADDKRTYRELASAPGLKLSGAAMSALLIIVLADRIRPGGLIVWTFFVPFGVLLSYVDWHTRLLPKRLVIPGNGVIVGLALAMSWVEGDIDVLLVGAISAVVVFVIFFLLWLIYPRGLGYGDVRLSGALALSLGVLGTTQVVVGLYAGFLIGAVCAIALTVLRIVDARQFAFGPYLVIGALVGAGWGPQLAALF